MSVISGSDLQTDISSLIDEIGTAVEVYTYNPTYNDRGDTQGAYGSTADSTPTVIPVAEADNLTKERYGEPNEGEVKFLFKGDATIGHGDKIVWNSINYKVIDADATPLSGTDVIIHVTATVMDAGKLQKEVSGSVTLDDVVNTV